MGGKSGGGGGYSMQPSWSTATTYPNPEAWAAYSRFIKRAENVADKPYEQYGGQLVAGMTPDQLQSYEQIRKTQGYSQPYYDTAGQWTRNAVNSLAPENYGNTVSQYMNPFQKNVVDATLATINNQNQQQLNDLTSKSILSGGMGGDRAGVSRAALIGQQNLSRDKTVADLMSQGYTNAQAQAMSGAQMGLTGASTMAGLGTQGMQSGLAETQALLTGGAQQQALQQLGLDTSYNQWLQKEQFPYGQTGWLASMLGAIGPQMGSTTTGMSLNPVQNQSSSGQGIVGGITSGLGLLNNVFSGGGTGILSSIFKADGGRVHYEHGGKGLGSITGGGPFGTEIPQIAVSHGLQPHNLHMEGPKGGGGGGGGHDPSAMGKALAGLFAGKKKAPESPAETAPATTETPATTPDTTPVIGPHDFAAGKVMGDIPTPPARPAEPYVPDTGLWHGEVAAAPTPGLNTGDLPIMARPGNQDIQQNFAEGDNAAPNRFVQDSYTPRVDEMLVDRAIRDLAPGVSAGIGPFAGLAALGRYMPVIGAGASLPAATQAPKVAGLLPPPSGVINAGAPEAQAILPKGIDPSRLLTYNPAPPPSAPSVIYGTAPPPSATAQRILNTGSGIAGEGSPAWTQEFNRIFGRMPKRPEAGWMDPNTPWRAAGGRVHFLRGGWGDGPVEDEMQGINPRTFHPELSANRDTGDRSMEVRPGDTFNFDRAAAQTRKFEGGYSNDSGGPTMYGISSKAHPGLDVRSLTPEQAKSMYKSEYWDAINADKIENPALRRVAYDTAIISGPGRAKQFLAQSGGDPAKFMDLREGFMNRLVSQNPDKYGAYEKGWANRNAELRRTAGLSGAPMAYSASDASPSSNAGIGAINKAISGGNIQVPQATAPETSYEDEQGLFMPKSMGNALLAAGLGIMSSRAPTLGQAIGEGGLTGLAAYSEGQAQRQKLAMDEPYRRLQMQKAAMDIEKDQYTLQAAKDAAERAKAWDQRFGMGQDATSGAAPVSGAPIDITGQGGVTTAGAPVSVTGGSALPPQIQNIDRQIEYWKQGLQMAGSDDNRRTMATNMLTNLQRQKEDALKVWEKEREPLIAGQKKWNEGSMEQATELMKSNARVASQLQNITNLEKTLSNVKTGKFADFRTQAGKVAAELNLSPETLAKINSYTPEYLQIDPRNASAAEVANKFSGRMVLDILKAGEFPSANFSNTDREFVKGLNPGINLTPEANKILIDGMRQGALRTQAKAKAWLNEVKTNPNANYYMFESQFDQDNPPKDYISNRLNLDGTLKSQGQEQQQTPVAVPPPAQRQDGGFYDTPKGRLRWNAATGKWTDQ